MRLKIIFNLFVVVGIFILIADLCVFDHCRMNGHWHMYRNLDTINYEREFMTIDYEGRFGTVNKNIEISFPLGYHIHPFNKTCEIYAECYHEEFTYKVNSDSLKLFSANGVEVYKGYKCSSSCCNQESDYFSAIPFNINLNEGCDIELIRKKNIYSRNCIFLSPQDTDSVELGYGVYKLAEIKKWIGEIEDTYSFESSGDHEIILYADKESNQILLEKLKHDLCQVGVKKIFFGYKCESLQGDFQVRLEEVYLSCGNAANKAPPTTAF